MYTNDIENESYEDEQDVQTETAAGGNGLKLLIIVILAIVAIGLIIFAVSKKKGSSSKNDTYAISIYPEDIVVPLGETKNISYEVKRNNERIQNATIRLESGDENIVTVENTNVKGVNYGKTALTIKYVAEDGKTIQDIKEVTVANGDPNVKLTNVNFPEGDLFMPINGTYDIKVTTEPADGYIENMKFTSSNSNVVLVDSFGKVTAVSEDVANITIDVNNGTFRKVLKVYVTKDAEIPSLIITPTKIAINSTVTTIKVGDVTTLTYALEPENAETKVTWSSSDESIVTVDNNGKITGIKDGEAIIKVSTSNGLDTSVKIVVEKTSVDVTEISLSETDINVEVSETKTLMPTVLPAEATDKTLTYESSDTDVVAVTVNADMSATITGVKEGTAIITIKSGNGIEKKVNITVSTPSETDPGSSGGGGSCSCSRVTCGAGKYCSCGRCYGCPAGNYCYNNKKTACPAGKGSVSNSSSYQDCSACAKGYYSTGNGKGCVACPNGKTTASSGATNKSQCNVDAPSPTPVTSCQIGYFINSSGKCQICTLGNYCANGRTRGNCPAGKGKKVGATSSSDCQLCDYGYTSTAGGNCRKCSSGRSNASRTQCL